MLALLLFAGDDVSRAVVIFELTFEHAVYYKGTSIVLVLLCCNIASIIILPLKIIASEKRILNVFIRKRSGAVIMAKYEI